MKHFIFKLSHYFYIKSGFLISLKQLEVLATLDTHTHSHTDTEELLLLEEGRMFSSS